MRDRSGILHIYEGSAGVFYDAETGGPLRLELERIAKDRYRIRRQFGYLDHEFDAPFICPHDVHEFETDLASIPWFFSWVVPSRGYHFPAIMLHDALVSSGEPEHLGPTLDRVEADRVMRDAMGQVGVGFVRRWLAWTGASLATVWADLEPKWLWRTLLIVTFGTIGVLGIIATLDVFDVWDVLPWMGERNTGAELLGGAVAAFVIPIFFSLFWGRLRRAAAIGGIALAFVLHVTIGMFLAYLAYLLFEYVGSNLLGRRRLPEEADRDQEALAEIRRITAQVGKGSSTFIDLGLRRPNLRLTVTGPKMLVDGLRVVTDLGVLEGHSHPQLVALRDGLQATAHCGRQPPADLAITVEVDRQGPALIVDVGPESMYESVITISTTQNHLDDDGRDIGRRETLEELIRRTIGSGTGRGYLVGVVPVPAGGHREAHGHAALDALAVEATEIDDVGERELDHGNA